MPLPEIVHLVAPSSKSAATAERFVSKYHKYGIPKTDDQRKLGTYLFEHTAPTDLKKMIREVLVESEDVRKEKEKERAAEKAHTQSEIEKAANSLKGNAEEINNILRERKERFARVPNPSDATRDSEKIERVITLSDIHLSLEGIEMLGTRILDTFTDIGSTDIQIFADLESSGKPAEEQAELAEQRAKDKKKKEEEDKNKHEQKEQERKKREAEEEAERQRNAGTSPSKKSGDLTHGFYPDATRVDTYCAYLAKITTAKEKKTFLDQVKHAGITEASISSEDNRKIVFKKHLFVNNGVVGMTPEDPLYLIPLGEVGDVLTTNNQRNTVKQLHKLASECLAHAKKHPSFGNLQIPFYDDTISNVIASISLVTVYETLESGYAEIQKISDRLAQKKSDHGKDKWLEKNKDELKKIRISFNFLLSLDISLEVGLQYGKGDTSVSIKYMGEDAPVLAPKKAVYDEVVNLKDDTFVINSAIPSFSSLSSIEEFSIL
ncbi:MAG: hypothetical protein ACHQ1H_11580 [Nitrososphaerales archaeon]